jgi:ectoine hydroxylase-related dioxygenase (phytanoyl-CoA dioxygenase family)
MIEVNDVQCNAAALQEYRERGYVITAKLLADDQIAWLREAAERIFRYDYDRDLYPFDRVYSYDLASPELRKINNGWWLNDDIRSLVLSPKLGALVAPLMETDEVRVWHDQVVVKPGVGAERADFSDANIGWHQDYAHWQVASSQRMCTIWIALQDTDLRNGGMRTIVGSHRWGLIPGADSFHDKDLDGLKAKYAGNREWLDEPCLLKAGQASIHHCLCMHGSGPNLTHEPRFGIIIHYMPGGTAYRGRIDPHAKIQEGRKGNRHANVPLLGPNAKPGDLFTGPAFPKVWPPDGTLAQQYGVAVDGDTSFRTEGSKS